MEQFNPDDIDSSIMDASMNLKEEQIKDGLDQTPDKLIEVELKIREGKGFKGEVYEVDGEKIRIPQLSIIQLRKAAREGLKSIVTTDLGKKIVYAMRSKADPKSEIDLSFIESLELQSATDVEDAWLVVYALRDVKHSKMTMDDENDYDYVVYLKNFQELVEKLREHNCILEEEKAVKFFRDDGSGDVPKEGDTPNKREDLR